MTQTPSTGDYLLKWRGETLTVTLALNAPRKGRACLRTNIGHARIRRREIIAEIERDETPLARAWTDIPLDEVAPGFFRAEIPLDEVGVFSGKACFFPDGSETPEWPEGLNFHVKVESAETRKANSIYTVFIRQFGSFREVVRRLPLIMDRMGFRIVQTLPPFPVPTTYAVMGEYGCPFAATDFLSVDPALAEFDERATPLDQFKELIGSVHARRGLFFLDLPANHTGWASTLQTHHPEWFHRERDGRFVSPGAWGVLWADLVELDYSNADLRTYMADVFLFWCRLGVDGFRCDAGYMIPCETWEYIVAKVREEYPDTIFMLEGLGGRLDVTDELLAKANLDWAYSEIFQTYDRAQFEGYLPGAIERSEKFGTLVHFAETHDNDRLAKGGTTYARLRVQLAALLSWQGAWGIANGVEWYCREKIDVHGKNDLNWGAKENMVDLIARLNALLAEHPAFEGASHLEVVTRGEGNTLAVLRDGLLILANLDCERGTAIDWDRSRVPPGLFEDLLTKEKCDLSNSVRLAPGEVKCVEVRPCGTKAVPSPQDTPETLFHIVYPRDVHRIVCVPENQRVEMTAPEDFRIRLIDPLSGRTVRVARSIRGRLTFDAPHYKGDGSRCRAFHFDVSRYVAGEPCRTRSTFLVPPRSDLATLRETLSGEEIRKNPHFRALISNGAGAIGQVRVAWGEIRSQYDALLSANPHPTCPSDRLNVWTRLRAWLQREGYARAFDSRCTTRFTADPAGRFAEWGFHLPCGMGLEASFTFRLSLVPDRNTAVLRVVRRASKANEARGPVRLVFRPDVEWRSFHATTKAYTGPEERFPKSVRPDETGFRFAPYDRAFTLRVEGGIYHHEPQWTYNVAHAEEAERGQDGSGDLFSPGWISADLAVGESVTIIGTLDGETERPSLPQEAEAPARQQDAPSLLSALRRALSLYIVRRDDLKTVIAGYPWFLDWGRDTFIFLRGMIAAGFREDALRILKAFAAFESEGTLPNIIYGETAGNRDTTDAPLWFIRCVRELGDADKAGELRRTCDSIVEHYIAGTPNGIRMDPASALIWSPSHFTWMDTNYPACTPRTGYPVEIQALWISALRDLGREELANRALESVKRLFKRKVGYADCLSAPHGESAAEAVPDEAVRPNQLFLVTLGILEDPSILRATEPLLVPGGIRTLNADHPLYRGTYSGDEDTRRKHAYHNGTAWAWPFPLYAEALAATKACPNEVALQLLASAVENLNEGCLCHLSEIAEGDAPHVQKGCCAQAWSDSELLRVWLKLGGK